MPFGTTHIKIRLALMAVLLVAAVLRLWYFDWGLPLLLHPDEWSQVDVAWRIAGGDLNPHFFRYGTGYMYLLAPLLKVADWLAGPLSQSDRYALVRVVTAMLGVLTVWLLWRWARLLLPEGWALGAAALLAIVPTHVIHSHYATVDVPLTLAVCMSGYALTRLALAAPERRRRWAYIAGAAIGLAIGVKYTAVLLLIPFIVVMVASAPARSRPLGRVARAALIAAGLFVLAGALLYRLELPQVVAFAGGLTTDGHLEREYLDFLGLVFWALVLGGVALCALAAPRWERWTSRLLDPALWQGLAIAVAVFVCSSPFVLLDYRHALVDIFYEYRHASIGAAAQVAEGVAGVGRPALVDNAAFYLRQLWDDFGPLLLFGVAGIVGFVASRRRLFAPVALLPLLMLLVALRSGNIADRYLLPAYPAISLVGVAGLYDISRRLARPRVWAGVGAAAVAVACILTLAARLTTFALPDTRSLAYDWIAAHIPPGSRVANENYTLTPNLDALPITQLLANRGFDPTVRWEGHADYLLLGASDPVVVPTTIDELREQYGPPVMVIAPELYKSQGPAQFIFRLQSPQASRP
jgi:4-amino-4-deoxy-L-arabinose transferase-like glycosyltransferase